MVSEKSFKKVDLIRESEAIQKDGKISFDLWEKFFLLGRRIKEHQRLCEKGCNDADFNFNLIDEKENKINEVIKELNVFLNDRLKITFQHDPRGLTAKLEIENGNFPKQIYQLLQ